MTIRNIFSIDELVNDNSEIFVRDSTINVLTHGNWYQDNILEYLHKEAESFIWQDDNKIYIDIK